MTSPPDQLALPPFVARRGPDLGFVLLTSPDFVSGAYPRFVSALSDPQLGRFVRESGRAGVVLDVENLDVTDAEARWLVEVWAAMIASAGVRRVAVVLGGLAPPHVGPQLHHAGAALASRGLELRPFPSVARAAAAAWASTPSPAGHGLAQPGPVGPAPAERSASLAVPAGSANHAMGWGAFVGALLGAALVTPIAASLGGPDARPEGMGLGAVLGAAFAAGGVYAVHGLRSRPPGRLTWDARGITEWAGDRAVTTIAWERARYSLLQMTLRGQGRLERGTTLQLADGSGSTITVCDGHRCPDWLQNRPAQIANVHVFTDLARPAQPMAIVPDRLGFGRGGRLGFGAVAIASYGALVGGVLFLSYNRSNSDFGLALIMIWAGCLLTAVRAIWPLTRIGSRLRASVGLEVALRGVLLLAFLLMSIGLLVAHRG